MATSPRSQLMQYRISVVRRGRKLMFCYENVYFTQLLGDPYYIGGCLSIYRRGKLFDKTTDIIPKENGSCRTIFRGFTRFYTLQNPLSFGVSALESNEFRTRDMLLLEFTRVKGFNFLDALRQDCKITNALAEAHEQCGEGAETEEVGQKFSEILRRDAEKYLNSQELIFPKAVSLSWLKQLLKQ